MTTKTKKDVFYLIFAIVVMAILFSITSCAPPTENSGFYNSTPLTKTESGGMILRTDLQIRGFSAVRFVDTEYNNVCYVTRFGISCVKDTVTNQK